MTDLDRRSLLKAIAAASAIGLLPEGVTPASAQAGLTLGSPEPFSFELLKQTARLMFVYENETTLR